MLPAAPRNQWQWSALRRGFAAAGIASLRYDKRASGPDAAESARILFGKLSMRSHLDELVAAVGVLASQGCIDAARIAGLGNSEGTLHVLHYATSKQDVPFVGIVLAAPPGRPVAQVLLSQLALQAAGQPDSAELMAAVEAAAARYAAGQPMDLDPRLPDSVRMVLGSFEAPANLPLARELWTEDPTGSLHNVEIPALVLIGRKDVQIDAVADGRPLEQAAAGNRNVTFAYPANANHVFKEDTRLPTEVAATPGNGYNTEGTHLDPQALHTIVGWLDRALA